MWYLLLFGAVMACRGFSIVLDLCLSPRQEGSDVGADSVVLVASPLPKMFARDPALYFSAAWVVMVKKMNDKENLIR